MTNSPAGAPAWNCVAYPGAGMHYVGTADGHCAWCGMTSDQVAAEWAVKEVSGYTVAAATASGPVVVAEVRHVSAS